MFEGLGEAWDGFMALPLWVKLLALIIAVGLILLLWQPWKSKAAPAASSGGGGGFLSSIVPGSPPPSIQPGVPPAPAPSTIPQLPPQVLQGSGYWPGAKAAATTPVPTPEGTFQWISQQQFLPLEAENQPIYYQPVPGDFIQIPYSSPGQLNYAGIQPGTPQFIEEPSQANAQAG